MTRWLNMPSACEYAHMSRKTMRRLINDGFIRADRIGEGNYGHWRIDRESIDSYFSRTDEKIMARIRGMQR